MSSFFVIFDLLFFNFFRIGNHFYIQDLAVPAAAFYLIEDLNQNYLTMVNNRNRQLWSFLQKKIGFNLSFFDFVSQFSGKRWKNKNERIYILLTEFFYNGVEKHVIEEEPRFDYLFFNVLLSFI